MGKSPTESLLITHLEIENWRNFSQVNIDLQRRVFVVGPNASGKSNLLDVLRFLHDLAPGKGLQFAVSKRGGVSRLRCLYARAKSDIRILVRLGTELHPRIWEYELVFNQDSQRRARIRSERVSNGGPLVLNRPDDQDRADEQRLSQTFLEQIAANKDFREIAAFFESIQYLHIVPQLVREPDRSVGRSGDPFGGDFLEQIAQTQDHTRKAWLRQINTALRVAVPQLSELDLDRDARGRPHLRGRFDHWRPQGAWQSEEDFSDGTLRLIGLLWSALSGHGPLLLEEPELSLHPDIVRVLPQMFVRMQTRTGRQLFTSTHSPELLHDDGIGLDETLLLKPTSEGTVVSLALAHRDIPELLNGGLTLGEAVIPKTRPRDVHQLMLFGDG